MANFVERMIGAAKLNVPIIEEIEADTEYTIPALGVVVLAAIAAGIGGAQGGMVGFVASLILSLFGWVFWAFLTWVIGTKFLATPETKSDMGELLRTMGFAQSPGILRCLGILPVVGRFIDFAVWIWLLVAMIVAVRQALDYTSTRRAILVVGIGWAVNAAIFFVVLWAIGIGGWIASGGPG
jgi:hypothetical protein